MPYKVKEKIKLSIQRVLAKKKEEGEVLPYATSIEVALLLKMNAEDVEKIAQDIEGMVKGRTLNHEYYYE